jgi:hypothetical protein
MSGWVIVRDRQDGGGFVARPGSPGSYTDRLQDARLYKTRSDAARDACPGNERPVSLGSFFPLTD